LSRLEEALQHLERAFEKREPALLMLRTLPWFEPIARRSRFKALLAAVWPIEQSGKSESSYPRDATG
jgi:hypothetical protein